MRKNLLLLILYSLVVKVSMCFADCFIIEDNAPIRSGPGEKYEIIGQIGKWKFFDTSDIEFHGDWVCILTKETLENKEEGWTFWKGTLSNGYHVPDTRPNVGTEVTIIKLDEKFKKIKDSEKKGIVLKYVGEERRIDMWYGYFSTFICQRAIYKPVLVKKAFVNRSLGRIVPGSYADLSRRYQAVKGNPSWAKEFRQCILEGIVKLGMTDKQVVAAWGTPSKINRSVGQWGVHEQWIYRNKYLYIENGKLTSFQDSNRYK